MLALVLGACITREGNPVPTSEEGLLPTAQPSTHIAYLAHRDRQWGLYVWDLESGAEKKLVGDKESVRQTFSWSPDGKRVVFQEGISYEEKELYIVNVLNGQVTRLTDNYTLDEIPDWSPCEDWIAFQSGVDASGGSKLWLIDPDSRERKTVIDDPDIPHDDSSIRPLWSPQALEIAVIIPTQGNTAWCIIDVNTGRMIQLIRHEGADVVVEADMAAWRPDGKAFAYVSDWSGTADIYAQAVAAQTASAPARLTDLSCNTVWLSWHPKGKVILFTCQGMDDAGQPESNLYTVDVETLEIQQLTHGGRDYYGSWSPDGERIAFGTERDGATFVAIMDADGANRMILEETKSKTIWSPKWAPTSGSCRQDAAPATRPIVQPSLPLPGPTTVILGPDISDQADPTALESARQVLQGRLDGTLESVAQVTVQAGNLRVELASAEDISATVQLAGQMGGLVFFDSVEPVAAGTAVPEGAQVIMTDDDVSQAQAVYDRMNYDWTVLLQLTPEGAQKLADYTLENDGHYLAMAYDGAVIFSSRITAPFLEDQVIIGGGLDQTAAKSLAARLGSGRLPFRLVAVEIIR